MLRSFVLFIKHLLIYGGFFVSEFPWRHYQALLTALMDLPKQPVVMIPEMIKLAKSYPGYLIIDDTNNPKFGLKAIAIKLFDLATKGRPKGYKIVLFLWLIPGIGRIPLGFALCHQETLTCPELALQGLSQLRNWYKLKPLAVLADGAYSTDEILKRLTDYDWRLAMRLRSDRVLDEKNICRLIPRGYGETQGRMENGTKLKVIRRKKFFLACNRMLLSAKDILGLYRLRWKIEEVFRVLKSCIGLGRCQQHSVQSQAVYLILCLLLFSSAELYSGGFPYKAFAQVISGDLSVENLLQNQFFSLC